MSDRLALPNPPRAIIGKAVRCWSEPVTLPTYLPDAPERHPMFLERRVYQGSSGRVYPLPVVDRIASSPVPRAWQAVHLENEYVRLMLLPELGGRIHVGLDRTNGYDFFYRQNVIKPALVGLAGPWCSGGVEFNWPQHHRPSTFMPTEVAIEEEPDGAVTVWLGEHEPMERMRGVHGVRLRPGSSVVELRVRLHNRTPFRQTFLWWANVAVRVHERYQSFFPGDVECIADHAKRATSHFPLCKGRWYGVDYGSRARTGVPSHELPVHFLPDGSYPPNDLSWYANIPVPTSYMALGSQEDFFGGYDHTQKAGLVHIADHRIAPGKKQWTWGNHDFGYAWDRHLTDEDGPYIELMAGVFTDNQPDFSFLEPGEVRSFSQYWYPIRGIGPADRATLDVAVSLRCRGTTTSIGVTATRPIAGATITLLSEGKRRARWQTQLSPSTPFTTEIRFRTRKNLCLEVHDAAGNLLVAHTPLTPAARAVPEPAREPQAPADIASADELYLTGLHLEQYRHATRDPEPYWQEALHRDPGDARVNLALGIRRLKRGEFALAEGHLRRAIETLTRLNPNPADGSPYYHLGLALCFQGRDAEAREAFGKALWNRAWQGPSLVATAELDGRRGDWASAVEHLARCQRCNPEDGRVGALYAAGLRRIGRTEEANAVLDSLLQRDPLDRLSAWLRHGAVPQNDAIRLDVALDLADAGHASDAIRLLQEPIRERTSGLAPLFHYHRAVLLTRTGDHKRAAAARLAAQKACPDWCFPARLHDWLALNAALSADPKDARAAYFLGNWLYDRRRYEEAITCWQKAVRGEPGNATAWRNLGIALYNVHRNPRGAVRAYERAVKAAPKDARLRYEQDQLAKRLGVPARKRLGALSRQLDLAAKRDDLTLEIVALRTLTGNAALALDLLLSRSFQPWEGGEGQALAQHARTRIALARLAVGNGDLQTAREHLTSALEPPESLGEAWHLLANRSELHLRLGDICMAQGDKANAVAAWSLAADARGDFQEMSVRELSEASYFSALALRRLGRTQEAEHLLKSLLAYARNLAKKPAKVDYFATSLPTMLLFSDDLSARQRNSALLLEGLALLGLERRAEAARKLSAVLAHDPSQALAFDALADATVTPPQRASTRRR